MSRKEGGRVNCRFLLGSLVWLASGLTCSLQIKGICDVCKKWTGEIVSQWCAASTSPDRTRCVLGCCLCCLVFYVKFCPQIDSGCGIMMAQFSHLTKTLTWWMVRLRRDTGKNLLLIECEATGTGFACIIVCGVEKRCHLHEELLKCSEQRKRRG